MAAGLNLPAIPSRKNKLMPAWVQDYADAVRLIANATVSYQTQPPYGSGAFTFGGANALLILRMNGIPLMNPSNLVNGTVLTGKLSSTGGSLTVVNGVITGFTNPT